MKRMLFAAAVAAAVFSSPVFAREDNTYLWVHPKLGPQRIDRATNAPPRPAPEVAPVSAQGTKATKLWVDPKGNVRRVPVKSPSR